MKLRSGPGHTLRCTLFGVAILLALPSAAAATKLKLTEIGPIGLTAPGLVRTSDGVLHVVYPPGNLYGLNSWSISPAGAVSPSVQVLDSTWATNQVGLVALPGGTLEAVFGGGPQQGPSTEWGISSTDGGNTWGNQTVIAGNPPNRMDVLTAAMSDAVPVLVSAIAGTVDVQQGLGPAAPNFVITNAGDGFAGGEYVAADALDNVVTGWSSLAGPGHDYLQQVAPLVGTLQQVPGPEQNQQEVAGSTTTGGVYAPYTTDGKHIRLVRYGGGTEAVGRTARNNSELDMGIASSIGGRFWVFWEDGNGKLAFTRSNKAVTRWEPVQALSVNPTSLFGLTGDGQLGPLDVLINQIPGKGPTIDALYHGRVLPELSASVAVKTITNKKHVVISHKLTVTVTDAGDAVSGATVTVAGHTKTTGSSGVAKISLGSSLTGNVTVTATAPTYQVLTEKIGL